MSDFYFFAGMNYGGPIPEKSVEGSSGIPIPGINTGSGFELKLSEKFSLNPELYLSFKGVEYSSSYTKDTMVQITIMGVPGVVPSYYTAFVTGKMNFHYLEMPIFLSFHTKRSEIMFGPFVSQRISGKDDGSVRVMIGDGGFYDDYILDFNNNASIHKTDFGFMFGSITPLFSGIFFELRVSRSIRSVYKKGFFKSNGNEENRLFNTYLHLSLGYRFSD
jgi:hypothetical protein